MMRSTAEDEAVLFHDMSTQGGHLQRAAFRWKWILTPLLLISGCLLLFGLSAGPNNTSNAILFQANGAGGPTVRLSTGKLEIHGDASKPIISIEGTTDFFQYFDPFPGILNSMPSSRSTFDPAAIKSLTLKWFKLDGPNLTAELGSFPNLEVLHLDNVTIFNQLQPVPLPRLRELYINQLAEAAQEVSDEFKFYSPGYSAYLASLFFFINDLTNSSDFYTKLAATRLNMSVWLQGSVVFVIDPGRKQITTDLPLCHQLLRNSTVDYREVTIGVGGDLVPTSISPRTTFLNLYLVSRSSPDLVTELLRNLPNLKQLFVELPGLEIGLEALPPGLRLLSASSIRLLVPPGLVLPALREFYFGSENQYKWVSEKDTGLLINVSRIMPNVERVGIFELHYGRYTFLKSVLESRAGVIVVQGFARPSEDSAAEGVQEDELEVEAELTRLGVPENATFFVIEANKAGGQRGGRSLSWEEQIELRYTMLGWDRIDNWAKYVHVRNLIDSGFSLGHERKPADPSLSVTA